MELIITFGIDYKSVYTEIRRNLLLLGFLVQGNILHMIEDDYDPPVQASIRRNIVIALSSEERFREDIKNYLHECTNPISTFIIYESDDHETRGFCEKYGYLGYSTSKLFDNFFMEKGLYINIFDWLSSGREINNRELFKEDFFINAIHIQGLKNHIGKVIMYQKAAEFELDDDDKGNPYLLFFKNKVEYDSLTIKNENAEKQGDTAKINEALEGFKCLTHKLDNCIGNHSGFTRFYILLAFIYQYKLKDFDNALMNYEKANKISVSNPFIPFYLASAIQRSGRPVSRDILLNYYRMSIEYNKICYQAYFKIARSMDEFGDLPEAIRYYDEIIRILDFSEKTGYIMQEEVEYIWKANFFKKNACNKIGRYEEALASIDNLIGIKKRGFKLGKTGLDYVYEDATLNYLYEEKDYMTIKLNNSLTFS